jgi:tetratricopeptide (TPR) repeat protein
MARASLLVVVAVAAVQISTVWAERQPAFGEAELLAGTALKFAPAAAAVAVPTQEDALTLDDEMQTFLAPLRSIREPRHKLLALISALEERGMFSLEYTEVTRTARSTFHERQGNCLSFTMLFVTLARALGLTASYQTVDVPPTWSNDGQVVIANHVNTVVRVGRGQETIVDFNIRTVQGEQRSRRVSDSYALGLFYTNLGAEALIREDYAASLAHLREAAEVRDDIAGLWVNLGVLYARHGHYEHAEAAYLRAIELDDEEQSALVNLVSVYTQLDEPQLAAEYRERVQDYRERNPYYHYLTAARAYEAQQFDDALTALRKAVRLKSDEHEFYSLRGEVFSALGRSRDATESFERAREYEAIEEARNQSPTRVEGLMGR